MTVWVARVREVPSPNAPAGMWLSHGAAVTLPRDFSTTDSTMGMDPDTGLSNVTHGPSPDVPPVASSDASQDASPDAPADTPANDIA